MYNPSRFNRFAPSDRSSVEEWCLLEGKPGKTFLSRPGSEIWPRSGRKARQSLHEIGRAFGKPHSLFVFALWRDPSLLGITIVR